MRIIVQRSLNSSVSIHGKIVGEIEHGLVLLIGFSREDTIDDLLPLVQKVLNLRIFTDEQGKMNRSIKDTNGQILAISQFTLYADTSRGNRPSYIEAMEFEKANAYYQQFCNMLREHITVATGIFGEDMKVSIMNDGPVTIILESRR